MYHVVLRGGMWWYVVVYTNTNLLLVDGGADGDPDISAIGLPYPLPTSPYSGWVYPYHTYIPYGV